MRPVFFGVSLPIRSINRQQKIIDVVGYRRRGQIGPFPAPHLQTFFFPGGPMERGTGYDPALPQFEITIEDDPRRPILDFEEMGMGDEWILSQAAAAVLAKWAATAIHTRSAIVHFSKNDRIVRSEERVLCDVIRYEQAVDEDASTMNWSNVGVTTKSYDPTGSRYVFLDDLPSDLHLFRLLKGPSQVFCSAALADDLKRAGFTGVKLSPGGFHP